MTTSTWRIKWTPWGKPWDDALKTKVDKMFERGMQIASPERQANVQRFLHALTGPWNTPSEQETLNL